MWLGKNEAMHQYNYTQIDKIFKTIQILQWKYVMSDQQK